VALVLPSQARRHRRVPVQAVNEREFMADLTWARDRFVRLMLEADKAQVTQLGEVLDGLYRDMRALHDQPKAR
jgi:hypothetical protein